MSESKSECAPEHQAKVARPDEHPGQVGRFGNITRMVIHPDESDPTAPNTGTITYPAGTGVPAHKHRFAQVWYILEGEFDIGGKQYGPGTMIFHPDPHYEEDLSTESGGLMLFVQYQGPTTGGRPIYDGRFNMTERKAVEDERTDI